MACSICSSSEISMTKCNIYSAFCGAGLVPFYPSKAIDRLPKKSPPLSPPQTPQERSILETTLITGSPPDINELKNANAQLIEWLEPGKLLSTPERQHIPRLAKSVEHLRAWLSIAEDRLEFMESVMGKWKERASGKRFILKDKFVYTQPEILEQLKAAERETKKRKKKGRPGSRKCKVPRHEVQSTSDDTDSETLSFVLPFNSFWCNCWVW